MKVIVKICGRKNDWFNLSIAAKESNGGFSTHDNYFNINEESL